MLIIIASVILIVTAFVFVNPSYVFAKMHYIDILNQTIDTQKPLIQQYEQAFEKTKATVSPAQYDRAVQKAQTNLSSVTSLCLSMSSVFKGVQFDCDQIFSVTSIICSTQAAKRQMVFCIDPFVNDYLKSRNITGTNTERYARYFLEQMPK